MAKIPKVAWMPHELDLHDIRGLALPCDGEVVSVPYSEIDVAGGLHNKAREHSRVIEDLVLDYATKMEARRPFKAIVLYLSGDGVFKYRVAHGNHRLRAFALLHNDNTQQLRSPKALVGAHIIESAYSDDIEEFERLANGNEGERQNSNYALINAVWLVQNRSMTLKRARERTGVPENVISDKIRGDQTRGRVERMGVATENLTTSHLVRLGSLKHESHLKHLAQIANDSRMPSGDLSKQVAHVNKLRTEAKGNAYIHDEYNRTRRERVGPRNGREPVELRKRRLFLKGFRQFEDLWLKGNDGRPVHSLSDIGISPQDRQVRAELMGRAEDLIRIMRQVMRIKKEPVA